MTDNALLLDDFGGPGGLLAWYVEAGVDECILDAPVDRYAAAEQARAAALAKATTHVEPQDKPKTPSVAAPPPPPSNEESVKSAVEAASAAKTLEDLKAALATFDACPLKKTATNLVFGDGNPQAKIVFIGEAPGAEEDRQGVPFVGPAGQLLDKMLASIGLEREDVFISNTVFWRPPGNRTPHAGEVGVCMPFVERLLEIIDPEILVTVGGAASQALLAQKGSMSKLRGRWFEYATPRLSRPLQAAALYHPAFLLRSPAQKRNAWRDLLMIKDKLDSLG